MANYETENITIGLDANISILPLDAVVEDATGLPAGAQFVGLIEESFNLTIEKEMGSVPSLQAGEARTYVKDSTVTIDTVALEDSDVVASLYFGKNPEADGSLELTGREIWSGQAVFDTIDNQKMEDDLLHVTRFVLPRARIIATPATSFGNAGAAKFGLTFKAFDKGGIKIKRYKAVLNRDGSVYVPPVTP